MTSAYFDADDLKARLSAATVIAIYDDDNSGAEDANPIARLIADASSKIDSYLRGVYTLPLSSVPNEVKRLALDVAVAYAAQRHPERVRQDWKPLLAAAEADLAKLREGKTRLDVVSTPEPAANQGGTVTSGIADAPLVVKVFETMGDF